MKKEKKLLVRIMAILLAAAMIIGSGFYLVYLIADNGSVAYGLSTDEEAYEKLDRLKDVIKIIDKYYKDDVDLNKLVDAAYNGVFDSLDRWSVYYSSIDEEAAFTDSLENKEYSGVGLTIQEQSDGTVKVLTVNPNGGALSAGVKKGDIITAVNGKSVEGKSSSEVADLLKGVAGTKVKITVSRKTGTFTFEVERRKIQVTSVNYEMLDGGIGYIQISNFNEGEGAEFRAAVEFVDSQGSNKLIIDLRDNAGGYTNEAMESLSAILRPNKTLVKYIAQGEELDKELLLGDENQSQEDYKIVVLVNENTASAAEIMAIAIKGNDAGKLVGVNTYGKGVAQQIISLTGVDSMKLSRFYFVGPNGETIDGTGIKPDYVVYNGAELTEEYVKAASSGIIPMNEGKKYLTKGSYGLNVLAAQQRLFALGYVVNTNSILDEATMIALSDVQKNAGLFPYGALDFSTIKALDEQFNAFLYGSGDAQLEKAIELLK